ncbi:hypothetical protein K490DRAFT_74372 [Saccharata proteae CBS 121410]|uniref:Ubiquinol-cytochrome c chaperone domain-containing protein n=1 Tax=Saccharata proteae CBS 121410 TaxID=1314787 RepID=A0A9P4HTY4_9PEZI|nr:hypothetical protein K490DRAFT_74372 [Saccharata proteae CBS 121410]
MTETYAAYGATEQLFKLCAKQADYEIVKDERGDPPKNEKGEEVGVGKGWWYNELGLTPTFNTWAQVTFLHMYMLTVRMRLFPAAHAPAWHQHLTDHFSYEAENRMVVHHNMAARGIRNRYLKDLFIQWRGVMTAYDEGLVKGDAVLATALWRNIYKGETVDGVGLAGLVAYVRRNLSRLEKLDDGNITAGEVEFSLPEVERVLVQMESPSMKMPFTEAQETSKKVQ